MRDQRPERRGKIFGAAALAVSLTTLALFVLCCWSAAADAQGAIAFVVLAPVLLGGAIASPLLARAAVAWPHHRWAFASAATAAGLVGLFYISALVPPMRPVANFMISSVRTVYKAATGETPYAADQRRSRAAAQRR